MKPSAFTVPVWGGQRVSASTVVIFRPRKGGINPDFYVCHLTAIAERRSPSSDSSRSICWSERERARRQLTQNWGASLSSLPDRVRGCDPAARQRLFLQFYS